jgi:hypothetical protein
MEKVSWDLGGGKVVQLSYTLSTDFNIDEITKIDIDNLLGEYLTAPVLFNTVANLRSLTMQRVGEKNLQLKIVKREVFLDILRTSTPKPSNHVIEAQVEVSDEFIQASKELIDAERDASMMDNLYWAIKEKCNKLDNLYHKILPEEFNKDIMEGQVNNILIKIKKSLLN